MGGCCKPPDLMGPYSRQDWGWPEHSKETQSRDAV
jgi:hypothetical protein